MAWVNLDDQFPDHKKIAGLSDAAFRLHVAGICYCNRHLSDGIIEVEEVPRLVRKYRAAALAELVERGLWEPITVAGVPAVYEIHDYLQWNDSRDVVKARRDRARERAGRSRGQRS